MQVALLPSCAQQALDRNINAATIRLLQRCGCEVVVATRCRLLRRVAASHGPRSASQGDGPGEHRRVERAIAERARRDCHQRVRLRHHRERLRTFGRRRAGETDWRSGARHHRAPRRAWSAGRRCRADTGSPITTPVRCSTASALNVSRDSCSRVQASRSSMCPNGISAAGLPELTICSSPTSRRRSANAKRLTSTASIRTLSPPEISDAWCRSRASRTLPLFTPSNCSIGRPAVRCRRPCSSRQLRQPKRAPAPSEQSHPGGSPSAADPNPTAIW